MKRVFDWERRGIFRRSGDLWLRGFGFGVLFSLSCALITQAI
jgi:hypothetical protein